MLKLFKRRHHQPRLYHRHHGVQPKRVMLNITSVIQDLFQHGKAFFRRHASRPTSKTKWHKNRRLAFYVSLAILFVLGPIIYLGLIRPWQTKAAPWATTATDWQKRKQVTLTNNSGQTLIANTTYTITVNTKELVDAGNLQADCSDLRVYYQPNDQINSKLAYYFDTAAGATNCADSEATKVYFPLQANLSNNSSAIEYYLYYDSPGATSEASVDAFDIGDKEALLVCPFNGDTQCVNGDGAESPTTESGAIRYSGGKSALSFDGQTYGSADSVNTSISLESGRPFTVEYWMFLDRYTGTIQRPFNFNSSNYMDLNNSGTLVVNSTGLGCTSPSINVSTNAWTHIALVYDGSSIILYKNGVGSSSVSCNSTASFSATQFGHQNNYYGIDGVMDEVRISSTTRYTSNFTPQTTPFVRDEYTKLLLHFDENGDDPRNTGKAIDDSGNGNHGTITGAKYVASPVGVDASATDTGKTPSQSYASHDGVFIEEGTTNKVTNPSFEHTTYDTNWAAGGNSFETFTQGNQSLSKRNAPGPFTAAPIVQGDPANANSLTDDVLSTSRGHAIGGNFYQTFDTTQGSVVLWWTPEYSYNSLSASGLHYIWYVNANYYLAYNYASDRYEQRIGAQTIYSSANIVAGTVYSLITNWDTKAPLSGSNYQCFTIDDGTPTCGTTQPTASAPSSFIYIGSNGTTGGGSGIIEGLTVYRRPLYDGTNGIDMGNGDEVNLTAGTTDRDSTLSTGSWDVVFALPTNSSVGAVSSGTGEAWSHPHASNLLGGTNGASGFMLNGTYTSDGFVAEGTPSSVAALSASEKIYGGGYKVTSDATNEGIYKDISVTAGQDFVIRGLAHSDGTAVPKLILYDQTNGAEIGSLTGTTTSTRTAPNMLLFTGEAPSGCTTIRVKLINTSSSGTTYWHQVEVLGNNFNNPSMERVTGNPNPWKPDDWSFGTTGPNDPGESVQSSDSYSGNYAFEFVNADGGCCSQIFQSGIVPTLNKYYSLGGYTKIVSGSAKPKLMTYNGGDGELFYQHAESDIDVFTNSTTNWDLQTGVGRMKKNAWNNAMGILSPGSLYARIDDVYAFPLSDVIISSSPSSQTNSTETAGLRVDGRDTAIQEISSLSDSSGSIKFKYTTRHSAADALKFIEVTDAYIAEFVGTATDYIRLYWNAANTITMAYNMNGTTGSSTWNATGAIVAGTTYDVQIDYTGGSTMTLAVGGSTRITLNSIPSSFGVAPYLAFWGSRKEGDRQGDAVFAPATSGSTFILNDVRFSPTNPSLAKRNGSSAGPFAAGVLMQGDPANASGLTDDTLSFHREKSIGEYFYTNFDTTQGSVALWWTPEYSYNSLSGSGLHYLWYANANYYLAYDYANDWYQLGAGGQTMTVASNIVAGTSQGLVARWDTKTTLDGTNYAALSIDDTHTYGITTQPSASVPATKIYVGSNGTTGAASGLIEGLTFYRRVLFDGTYGVNANAGVDEVTVVKNSGGSDPTLITGSWDIVFALPTNSAVGNLVTGTGEAWSHPHASNLLGGTNGAAGFMLNGTYTTDGFTDEGTPSSVAALSASEKIYGGGYKVTSDAANEGIYKDITVTAGQDFVIRGLAHSDGTAVPKLILYDQTNGAEIGSLTGTTTSTRTAPNMLLFTGEAPTGCTTIRVKLINTAASGTAYWHQVEVIANKISNPSFEIGAGDPWVPTGWGQWSYDPGELIQNTSDKNSGYSSIQIYGNAQSGNWNSLYYDFPDVAGNFYSSGMWGKKISDTSLVRSGIAESVSGTIAVNIYPTTSTWAHITKTGRVPTATYEFYLGLQNGLYNSIIDDVYIVELENKNLIVSPASSSTSTESNQLRVDGKDTYTHTLPSLTATSGTVNFSYTPRHSAADVAKFGETTPYIAKLMSGATDYIALYWSAANTLRLEYQMNGGTVTNSTWAATGAITAGTTYNMQITYTGGGSMVLSVDGTARITLSSIPSTFADAPNVAYWGSNSNGANQGDATIVPQAITATENTTAPYSKYATSSARLVNTSGDSRGYVTSINPANTNTHTLSAYVYDGTTGNVGGTVSATVAKLVFNGSVVTPSAYTDMGGGWWRLSYSAATANSAGDYGVQALSGKTIYVDGVQLEEKTYMTSYADGSMGTGYSWTGTTNESSSTRSQPSLIYPSTNNISGAKGTVSLWVKFNDVGRALNNIQGDDGIFDTNEWISNNFRIMRGWGGNTINVGASPGGGSGSVSLGSSTTWAGKWQHIVGTWDGTTITAYLNSISKGTAVQSGNLNIGNLIVGKVNGTATNGFDISNLQIFDTNLSPSEVASLYYSGLGSHEMQSDFTEQFSGQEEPTIYWKFDEGFGEITYDSSQTGNNGVIDGATWSDDTFGSAPEGKSLQLDGVDDHVYKAYADDIELDPVKLPFSTSVWFKAPSSVSAQQTLIARYAGSGYKVYMNASGQLCFGIDDDSTWGPDDAACSTQSFADSNWHLATAIKGESSIALYVDAVQVATTTITATGGLSGSSPTFYVGIDDDGTSNPWKGFLDEVRTYSYALSTEQILTEFSARGSVKGVSSSFTGEGAEGALGQGLVGYWKMDEASWNGTAGEVIDASGNGNHGARSGDATTATGKFGKGGTFDGTSDYVSRSNDNGLLSANSVTIATWIKSNSQTGTIIYRGHPNGDCHNYRLSLSSGALKFGYVGCSPYSVNEYTSSNSYTWTDGWHYVVATYTAGDGNSLKLYIDGSPIAGTWTTGNGTASPSTTYNQLNIGTRGTLAPDYFNGLIDEARIYNRALSPAEVQALYNWAPGPVGHWTFDEGSGQSAYDKSGNNNTGTLGASSSLGNDDPVWAAGKYGKGLNFDGGDDYIVIAPSSSLNNFWSSGGTIGLWIKENTFSNDGNIISKYLWSANAGWHFRFNGTVTRMYSQVFNSINEVTTYGDTPRDALWHYHSFVFDRSSNKLKFFLDGVLVHTTTGDLSTVGDDSAQSLYIGKHPDGARALNGIIDDVRIYNYARTPQQIVEDMNAGHPPPGSPIGSPLVHFKFDEGYGTTVNNAGSGGSALNGTLTSMASPATATSGWSKNGRFDKALNFDGTDDWIDVPDTDLTNEWTISVWAKPLNANQFQGLLGGSVNYINLESDRIHYKGTNHNYTSYTQDLDWHHYLLKREADGYVSVFLDGVRIDRYVDPDTIMEFDEIGRFWGSNDYSFEGAIDELKIYTSALTDDQVKAEYNMGKATVLGSLSTEPSWWLAGGIDPSQVKAVYQPVGAASQSESYKNLAKPGTYDASLGVAPSWSRSTGWTFNGTTQYLKTGILTSVNHTLIIKFSNGAKDPSVPWSSLGGDAHQHLSPDYYTTHRYGGSTGVAVGAVLTQGVMAETFTRGYYNGNLETSGITQGLLSRMMLIGTNGGNSAGNPENNYFTGNIEAVAIYSANLTDEQVKSVSQAMLQISENSSPIHSASNTSDRSYCPPGDSTGSCGPVAEWKFDENTGTTTVNDTSGNANHGTMSGDMTNANWVPGKVGSALSFDGVDDYVNTNTNFSWAVSESFALSTWIKLNGSGNMVILGKPSPNFDYMFGVSNLTPSFWYWSGVNPELALYSNTNMQIGKWHHLTVVYGNGVGHLFLDGQIVATDSSNINSFNNSGVNSTVGYGYFNSGNPGYLNGTIDQFRIYNYARTPAQIAWDYNRGKPVAHYKLDECSGTTIHSTNDPYNSALDGTWSGSGGSQTSAGDCSTSGTAWGNGATGKLNASMNFDGTDDSVQSFLPSVERLPASSSTTVSMWIKANSIGSQRGLFVSSYGNHQRGRWGILIDSTGKVFSSVYASNATTYREALSSTSINIGSWHHVMGIFDRESQQLRTYLDGKLVGTGQFLNSDVLEPSDAQPESIGANIASGANSSYFSGQIDDVQIFNYALTPQQIQTVMNSGAIRYGQ